MGSGSFLDWKILYSTTSFVGGVSLGDSGLFVLDLEAVPFIEPTDLRARKSYFFVDGKIVALGSNISGGTASHETHTTLFQTRLNGDVDHSYVNGSKASGLDLHQQSSGDQPAAYIDTAGNSYYLVGSTGEVELRALTAAQPGYPLSSNRGGLRSAYLDHGIKPDNHNYEHVVIPADAEGQQLSQLMVRPDNFYRVLVADGLHLVEFPEQRVTAYAFYELQETPAAQLVKSASLQTTVITKEQADRVTLAVSVPDLGWQAYAKRLQADGLSYTNSQYARQ